MLPHYFTVKPSGEHEIIIQKSRFIAHVARVESELKAHDFIAFIKKQHRAASHNCSAYMIGENDQIQKANDDGEPTGTAGVPMLEVLKKRQLKDTVIVVTRYFGGIKLGGGGLIRAYGKATTEGINATGVVERRLNRLMTTTIDYTLLGKVENELRTSDYVLDEMRYLENVQIDTFVEEEQVSAFNDWMTEITNGQALSIEKGELSYRESDIL
jgi:uncharacterized YigZ family protein